jgi:hypothetical protein
MATPLDGALVAVGKRFCWFLKTKHIQISELQETNNYYYGSRNSGFKNERMWNLTISH